MVVCGQTFSAETIGYIQSTIKHEPAISRGALSRRVCGKLNWRSPSGKLKEMSCRRALLRLEKRGTIQLPAVNCRIPRHKEKTLSPSIRAGEPIECSLAELGDVELVRVKTAKSHLSKSWNDLMERYHSLGSGPLCGAQLRYLIRSSRHGWVGGLAFSASAWRIEARDRWIGWSDRARRENLPRVVSNSRFLICPWVKVHNLASHVLAKASARLGGDWEERYGFSPVLLETFVDSSQFSGVCYRAANWHYVGQTAGRGRQDRNKTFSLTRKDVYVYALNEKAREVLCHASRPQTPCEVTQDPRDWAEQEFGRAELHDERLRRRLLTLARDFYERPQANVPQACQSRAKTRAAYRFFDHPNITMDALLKPHYEATLKRISEQSVVLVAQDTTTLNYSAHPLTEGIGPISPKKTKGAIGLLLHDSMAFNAAGTPLGLLDVQCWARDPQQYGKKALRHALSIEQKESHKWLKSFHAVSEAKKCCPETTLVSVGDREADIYELFHLAMTNGSGAQLLVRAEHNRVKGGVRFTPVASSAIIRRVENASHPVAGVDYPRTFEEFDAWFGSEDACRRYLARLRWPSGFTCPHCGARGKAWRTKRGLFHCASCQGQTSVIAGTIFEGTRKPLRLWFLAMWFVTSQKHGANAMGLQRVLGLRSYETAWAWLHKLRRAMVRPRRDRLKGSVEVDESYVGGEEEGVAGRYTETKAIVVIAVEMQSPKGFGRVRMQRVSGVSASDLTPFVCAAVEPGSIVHTDGWSGYNGITKHGYQRQITVTSASGDPAHVAMPGAHRVAARALSAKRCPEPPLSGVCWGISARWSANGLLRAPAVVL